MERRRLANYSSTRTQEILYVLYTTESNGNEMLAKSYGKISSESMLSALLSATKDGLSAGNSTQASNNSGASLACTELVFSGMSTFCSREVSEVVDQDASNPISLIDSLFNQLSSSLHTSMQGKLSRKLPITSFYKRHDIWRYLSLLIIVSI